MKVKMWAGPLRVLQFVAQNRWDTVAECEGRDGSGERIMRFIIASHELMFCHQDNLLYPEAPDIYFFIARAKGANLLDTPSPLLPTDYID
jgi:hypothetical protein